MSLEVVLVDCGVTSRVVPLPVEEFDHHHPRDAFVEVRVDAR